MRIGIEVQRIFRKNKHGMEVVGVELIKELQRSDPANEYVLFAKNGPDKDCIKETPNFRIQTFDSLTYADWEQVVLPRILEKENIDLLHCTCNTGPVFAKVPMILTLHDIIYLENLNFRGSSYQNFGNIYRRIVVPKVVQRSSLIITVSEFEKKLIRERLEVPEEKVKVVYNGVNENFFKEVDRHELDQFRQKQGLPSQFLMFLGNLAPKKNTRNVLKAYAYYCATTRDPLPLVVLDFDKNHMTRLLQDIKASGCISNLYFPGYIPAEDMPKMYQCASVFLYPSLRESFGMPILEAMACGTPVITSNTSSMPEVANDAALYVDPFSPEDILRGIITLTGSDQLAKTLIQKGKERAKAFSWKRAASQVIELYDYVHKKMPAG